MKLFVKLVFMLFPFLVLGTIISVNYYLNSKIFKHTQDADGFIMGSAENRFVVHTKRSTKNEVTTNNVVVTDRDGKVVQDNSFSMDHDMYGLGFVKAMQADSDPALEVVAWGNNLLKGEAFILDYADGTIIKRPIEELSSTAQGLIESFKKTTLRSYGLTVFNIILTPMYYIFYLIVFLILRAFRKKPTPVASN